MSDGLSATHQEYRLAQEMGLPTLVCVKGGGQFERDEKEKKFFDEVSSAGHTYSRYATLDELRKVARSRLIEYVEKTFETEPTQQQNTQTTETIRSASDFERRPVPTIAFADLDSKLARQLAAAAEDKPADKLSDDAVREALVSRGYLWFDQRQNIYRPTAAAVLLLAKSPAAAFANARIQLDTYAGIERDARPTDSVLLDAPLPSAIEQSVAFVRRNTPKPLKVEGLKRASAEAYPQEALREAIVNAVAHRDYEEAGAKITVEVFSDRVVFSNPGLPPGNQRIEQIARGDGRSRARNPLIVQGLTWLEFMDERGSGVRRMRESMQRNGLELPRFALAGDEFTVTLPSREQSAELSTSPRAQGALDSLAAFKSLTEHQSAVLKRVLESGHVQTAWCVQNLGISRDTAWRLLNDLVEQGFLITTGTGRGTRYVPGNRLADQAHQAQAGRKDRKSGVNQAQAGRKDMESGANEAKSDKPSSAASRKRPLSRGKR